MKRSLPLFAMLTAALLVVFSGAMPAAHAQQQPRKRFGAPGTVEVGGSTTFAATQPVIAGTTASWVYDFSFLPYAGYFIIEGLELGINPAGISVHSAGDTSDVRLRVLFAPAYNFRTGTIATPFLEGLAGLTSASLMPPGKTMTSSGFTFGGRMGIKAALAERGLLTIGVQFLRITLNPSGASSRTGANELSISAGWTVWW